MLKQWHVFKPNETCRRSKTGVILVENESTSDQREIWNEWNAAGREADLGQISLEQAAVV